MAIIVETETVQDKQAHVVQVSTYQGDEVTGRIIKGLLLDDGTYDLDMPFTMLTEDGDKVRVSSPWNCNIDTL